MNNSTKTVNEAVKYYDNLQKKVEASLSCLTSGGHRKKLKGGAGWDDLSNDLKLNIMSCLETESIRREHLIVSLLLKGITEYKQEKKGYDYFKYLINLFSHYVKDKFVNIIIDNKHEFKIISENKYEFSFFYTQKVNLHKYIFDKENIPKLIEQIRKFIDNKIYEKDWDKCINDIIDQNLYLNLIERININIDKKTKEYKTLYKNILESFITSSNVDIEYKIIVTINKTLNNKFSLEYITENPKNVTSYMDDDYQIIYTHIIDTLDELYEFPNLELENLNKLTDCELKEIEPEPKEYDSIEEIINDMPNNIQTEFQYTNIKYETIHFHYNIDARTHIIKRSNSLSELLPSLLELSKFKSFNNVFLNSKLNSTCQPPVKPSNAAKPSQSASGSSTPEPEPEYLTPVRYLMLPSSQGTAHLNWPNPWPVMPRDNYAAANAFWKGWPVAGMRGDGTLGETELPKDRPNLLWPVHCYGMVGVGRGLSPDTGTGAELYTVIGHAPRHLDRNIALSAQQGRRCAEVADIGHARTDKCFVNLGARHLR
jgi:hypothetical protein